MVSPSWKLINQQAGCSACSSYAAPGIEYCASIVAPRIYALAWHPGAMSSLPQTPMPTPDLQIPSRPDLTSMSTQALEQFIADSQSMEQFIADSHAIYGSQSAEERDKGAAPDAAGREALVSRLLTCLVADDLADGTTAESSILTRILPSEGLNQPRNSQPCWGQLISGGHSQCDANFSTAAGHFNKKFCGVCFEKGFGVCPSRARLLLPYDVKRYVNPTSHHFWSRKDGLMYRIINQTNRCIVSPILIAFGNDDLDWLGFAPIPDCLVEDGALHLSLCHGTLVPSMLCKNHLDKRERMMCMGINYLDDRLPSALCQGNLGERAYTPDESSEPCWGHHLSGGHSLCDAYFRSAAGRLTKRFCGTCAANGISISPSRARLLPRDDVKRCVEPTSHELWSCKDGLVYRIVNQTNRCIGSPIVIAFGNDDLDWLGLEPIPDCLILNGALHLILRHGTLVPSALCKAYRDDRERAFRTLDDPSYKAYLDKHARASSWATLCNAHLGECASTPEESLEPYAAAPPFTPACMNPFLQLCTGYAVPAIPMDWVWGSGGSGRAACDSFSSDDPPPNSKRRRGNEVPLTALKCPIMSTPAAAAATAAAAAAIAAATAATAAAAQAASKASAAGSEPTDMQVARDLQPGAHDSFTQHTRNDRLALGCHPQAPQEPCSPTRVCLGLP